MKFLKKVCLLLGGIVVFVGLSISLVESSETEISFTGGMDTTFSGILSGNDPQEGKNSIWEHKMHKWQFQTTHMHTKLGIDISDKLTGEIYSCLTHHDYMGCTHYNLITAFTDYELFSIGDFGEHTLGLQIGRFLIPYGYFNSIAINPANQKSLSRPLMFVDHAQADMELHGGPKPIFHTSYTDVGAGLSGSSWVRDGEDQLWYGIYVINGLWFEREYLTGEGVDLEWNHTPRPFKDSNASKSVGGKISYSYGDLFTIGGSATSGKYDENDELRYTIYGGDAHLALGRANLRFEYHESPVEWISKTPGVVYYNFQDIYTEGTREKYTKTGWYVQLDFPFDMVFKKTKLAKKFEFVTMFSYLEQKPAENIEEMSRFSIGVNYFPEAALGFRFEYQLTILGDMNSAGDIAKYGEDFDNLNRVQTSVTLAF